MKKIIAGDIGGTNSLSDQYGRKLTRGSIPQENWDRLKDLGMDLVRLMGVWRPNPAGIAIDGG